MFFTDQLQNTIELRATPQRIISLVPSQTEFLCDIGLADKLVGITKFCIHPKEICKNIAKIGGTKNFHFEKIAQLQPDLIIANKEENYREGIEELQKKYPVWVSDIVNLEDSYAMMSEIGKMTKKEVEASAIIQTIHQNFAKLQSTTTYKKVIYLIWNNPIMVAGKNTFIDVLLEKAGFQNLITKSRYPEITLEDMQSLKPDCIFLSSEPYPFAEKHLSLFQNACPLAKVVLVDGELFSWYGSRLIHSAKYFQELRIV